MGQREVAPLLSDEKGTASTTTIGLCCLCPANCRSREESPLLRDYRFHVQPRPRRFVLFIIGRGGGGHKASANAVQAALLGAGHEWAADIEMVDVGHLFEACERACGIQPLWSRVERGAC